MTPRASDATARATVRRRPAAITAIAFTLLLGGRAAAQETPPIATGDLVEALIVGPAGAAVGQQCTATASGLEGDTLVVTRSERCPRGSFSADLRVARGMHASRAVHMGIGTAAGAILGGVIGYSTAGNGCLTEACDTGSGGSAGQTIAGAAIGAAVGAVVGYVLPTGPRWVNAGTARPLRVAGLALRPGLRVSSRGRPTR